MFVALFNKHDDLIDNTGILGFLECVFWENQIFLWTLSVASTYNIVTMTVEKVSSSFTLKTKLLDCLVLLLGETQSIK